MEKKDFVVRGTGNPLRQFIHSEDLAKLIMWTLLEYNEKSPIILSVGEEDEVSIRDIAIYIARVYGYEEHLVFDPSYSDGQYKKTADNSKLMSYINNFKFKNIELGIEETVKWFIQNYENCR